MLTIEQLKGQPEILRRIDWDLDPQEAFEAYQVKSKDSWKYRDLPEVFHFSLYVWKGEARVFLVRRSLKSAEDIAEIAVPPELVSACLRKQAGEPVPSGHYAIDDTVRDWIRAELGLP
jgi:hypothetical protein